MVDSRDGAQPSDLILKRPRSPIDLLLDLTQFRFRKMQAIEQLSEQKSMMLGHTTFQSQLQFRDLVPQHPFGHLGQPGRVLLPTGIAFKIALPEAPKASVATNANLILASSRTF